MNRKRQPTNNNPTNNNNTKGTKKGLDATSGNGNNKDFVFSIDGKFLGTRGVAGKTAVKYGEVTVSAPVSTLRVNNGIRLKKGKSSAPANNGKGKIKIKKPNEEFLAKKGDTIKVVGDPNPASGKVAVWVESFREPEGMQKSRHDFVFEWDAAELLSNATKIGETEQVSFYATEQGTLNGGPCYAILLAPTRNTAKGLVWASCHRFSEVPLLPPRKKQKQEKDDEAHDSSSSSSLQQTLDPGEEEADAVLNDQSYHPIAAAASETKTASPASHNDSKTPSFTIKANGKPILDADICRELGEDCANAIRKLLVNIAPCNVAAALAHIATNTNPSTGALHRKAGLIDALTSLRSVWPSMTDLNVLTKRLLEKAHSIKFAAMLMGSSRPAAGFMVDALVPGLPCPKVADILCAVVQMTNQECVAGLIKMLLEKLSLEQVCGAVAVLLASKDTFWASTTVVRIIATADKCTFTEVVVCLFRAQFSLNTSFALGRLYGVNPDKQCMYTTHWLKATAAFPL